MTMYQPKDDGNKIVKNQGFYIIDYILLLLFMWVINMVPLFIVLYRRSYRVRALSYTFTIYANNSREK
jgi:hypothetical protein